MYKYEMDPTRNVGTTEQTWDAGRTDGRSETNIPPQQLRCAGGIIKERKEGSLSIPIGHAKVDPVYKKVVFTAETNENVE